MESSSWLPTPTKIKTTAALFFTDFFKSAYSCIGFGLSVKGRPLAEDRSTSASCTAAIRAILIFAEI